MGYAQFGSHTLAGSAGEPNVADVNPSVILSEGDVVIRFIRHGGSGLLIAAVAVVVVGALLVATAVVVTTAITAVVVVGTLLLVAAILLLVATVAAVVTAALRGAVTAAEQLEILGNDADAAAALAGLLIFPCIHLQAALDEDRAALAQVLCGHFTCAAPACYIQESCFFAAFAFVRAAGYAVHSQSQFSEGVAAGCLAYLRICREVADKHDFVQISHMRMCFGV